jgi:hypothetical protein
MPIRVHNQNLIVLSASRTNGREPKHVRNKATCQLWRNTCGVGTEPRSSGPVWFSFFLNSFSENLAVERIWLWGESEYHYDYVWKEIKLFIGLRI